MNEDMLEKLRRQYESLKQESGNSSLISPFTTDEDGGQRETARKIVEDVMRLLEQKTTGESGHGG